MVEFTAGQDDVSFSRPKKFIYLISIYLMDIKKYTIYSVRSPPCPVMPFADYRRSSSKIPSRIEVPSGVPERRSSPKEAMWRPPPAATSPR